MNTQVISEINVEMQILKIMYVDVPKLEIFFAFFSAYSITRARGNRKNGQSLS